jgi:hypothetical protein
MIFSWSPRVTRAVWVIHARPGRALRRAVRAWSASAGREAGGCAMLNWPLSVALAVASGPPIDEPRCEWTIEMSSGHVRRCRPESAQDGIYETGGAVHRDASTPRH